MLGWVSITLISAAYCCRVVNRSILGTIDKLMQFAYPFSAQEESHVKEKFESCARVCPDGFAGNLESRPR